MCKKGNLILEISIEDEQTYISRNYDEAFTINNQNNKELLALIDAMMHPDKYEIFIHDLRTKNVYSRLTGHIDKKKVV